MSGLSGAAVRPPGGAVGPRTRGRARGGETAAGQRGRGTGDGAAPPPPASPPRLGGFRRRPGGGGWGAKEQGWQPPGSLGADSPLPCPARPGTEPSLPWGA